MSYSTPATSRVNAYTPFPRTPSQKTVGPVRGRDCAVCMGQHEDEIHTATLRVRRWFRVEVTKGIVRRPVC